MVNRPCIILCNFNEKEIKLLKSYGAMMGLKDQIIVTWKNGNSIIRDILENNIDTNSEVGVKDRAIIFNDLPNIKVSMFIDNMRKMRIAPAMKAVVTETSIEWTLDYLLRNLVEERRAEKQGKVAKHI
ncbi:DUF3783 domain-containing protein [Clostridium paraputrificum]|uniref:DUF3783 domain-containing protein n=1 Tax=Clostridium TaxID=1485 RepID=UPI003D332A08